MSGKARIRHFTGRYVRIKDMKWTAGLVGVCEGFDFAADFGRGKYKIDFQNGYVGWYKRCEFELLDD